VREVDYLLNELYEYKRIIIAIGGICTSDCSLRHNDAQTSRHFSFVTERQREYRNAHVSVHFYKIQQLRVNIDKVPSHTEAGQAVTTRC